MAKLTITIGVPGSGKTTRCREWAAEDGGFLVGRDHIRHMAYGKYWGLTDAQENEVTKIQRGMTISALARGVNVYVDDTNLNKANVFQFAALAMEQGAEFVVEVIDVGLETAIARDKARDRTVGANVIRKMYRRMDSAKSAIEPAKAEFKLPAALPKKMWRTPAVIVDIDGTVARIENDSRSHYETGEKLLADKVNLHVAEIVSALEGTDAFSIIFLSGRDEAAREFTQKWLDDNGLGGHRLIMRKAGDNRRDSLIKAEIYRNEIEPYHDVLCAIDDRPRVLRAWKQLGIPTLRVGDIDDEF